jgi:diadenosine tetraphosphate (Ap4A) HIT family hydrolase
MNNKQFPWLILVPRRENIVEWIDLPREEQHQLSDEIAICSHILQAVVTPEKLNIATLGNQVAQLHVHIIARYSTDNAWPNPVWGCVEAPYADNESARLIYDIKTALNSLQLS